MRKILVFLLLILTTLTFSIMGPLKISADEGLPLSQYVIKLEDVINRKSLEGDVVLNKQIVRTLQYGDTEINSWAENTYQYVTMPSVGNDAISVVCWSKNAPDAWSAGTVRQIAYDFEARNPGWIVVAGVNGDWFNITTTQDPTNTFVQNGDIYKSEHTFTRATQGVIGFVNDRAVISGLPASNPFLSLKILKGDQYLTGIDMSTVNNLPTNGGISLFTTDFKGKVDLSGYTVYVGKYIVNRFTDKSHFVKGTIQNISHDMHQITSVPLGSFYLVTKDNYLEETLMIGTEVKCEHELIGKFANIKNTMGYDYKLITNGQVHYQGITGKDEAMIGTFHPRTVIGFKEDGSIILMVIDGRQSGYQRHGVGLFEAGELLRIAGAVEGYNLDSGGSSTLIARNDNGYLEVINSPSDGDERSVGNAVLFVMRDPKIKVAEISGSKMVFEQSDPLEDATIKDIKVKVGNNFYPLTDGKIEVSGLLKNTLYNVLYQYTLVDKNGKETNCSSKIYKIKTNAIDLPTIAEFEQSSVQHLGITLKYKYSDKDKAVINAYIVYDDQHYELTKTSGKAVITGLIKDKEYNFKLLLELNNGEYIYSDVINFTAQTKASSGSGCQTGNVFYFVSILSIIGLGALIFKRKE